MYINPFNGILSKEEIYSIIVTMKLFNIKKIILNQKKEPSGAQMVLKNSLTDFNFVISFQLLIAYSFKNSCTDTFRRA